MRRLCTILIILATAFSAATGLYSGGRVLCVGADDHVAIELGHNVCSAVSSATHDEPAVIGAGNHDDEASFVRASESCSDFELPGIVVDRSTNSANAVSQQILTPLCTLASLWVSPTAALSSASIWAGPSAGDSPPSFLGCHRSIVLLT